MKTTTSLVLAGLMFVPHHIEAQSDSDLIPEICVLIVVVGVGVVITVGICKISKLVPPCENPPPPPAPPSTNAPPRQLSLSPATIQIRLSGDSAYVGDISGTTFSQKDPAGNSYTRLFSITIRSCTNLPAPWTTECTVTGWVSPAYVISVIYKAGQPLETNLSTRTANNACHAPITADESAKMFSVDQ